MARVAQGRHVRAMPLLTGGFTDFAWPDGGEASKVDGVLFHVTGEIEKCGGVREYISWSLLPFFHPIDGFGRYTVPRGPTELLFSHGGRVSVLRRDATEDLLTDRTLPRRPSDGEDFASHNGWCYMFNGRDRNMKWNGAYTAPVGVSEIPTPPSAVEIRDAAFATAYSIAAAAAARTFQYRATFVSSSGHEGPPSAPGTAATSPNGGGPNVIRLTGMNLPITADILFRNLYKRAIDGFYYLWRRIGVHETVAYDHEQPFAEAAGALLDESKQAPPSSRCIAFFRGRGYYVPATHGSLLYYSYSGFPETISGLQFLDVNSGDGESIVAVVPFYDMLVIFKPHSTWTVTARSDGTPTLNQIDTGVGAIARRAVVSSYNRLFFVGADGIYSFDGAQVKPMTSRLNRWWKQHAKDWLVNAFAIHDEDRRRIVFALPRGTRGRLDTLLSLHYELGNDAWSIQGGMNAQAGIVFDGNPLLGIVDDQGHAQIVILGGSHNNTLTGYNAGGDPTGTTIGATFRGLIRLGPYTQTEAFSADQDMDLVGFDFFFPYCGSHSLTIRVFKDRSPVAFATKTMTLNQSGTAANFADNQDLQSKLGWGEKDWGQSTWNGRPMIRQRFSLATNMVCREFTVEIENANDDQPYALVGMAAWLAQKGSERER